MPEDRRPYETVPKDGRYVKLWGGDEGPYVMRWNPRGFNDLVSTKPGIWEGEGFSAEGFTWCDEEPSGAPTHWAPV